MISGGSGQTLCSSSRVIYAKHSSITTSSFFKEGKHIFASNPSFERTASSIIMTKNGALDRSPLVAMIISFMGNHANIDMIFIQNHQNHWHLQKSRFM